jgi:cbb3-type cytochrome oxidase maturation protein
MTNLVFLIPVALFLGALGLGAFLWALRSGQYEDLDGAAERILIDEQKPESRTGHASGSKAAVSRQNLRKDKT